MTGPLEPTYDPETLREVYADPDAVRARVQQLGAEVRDALDEIDELRARGELVAYLRGLGELDDALAEAQRAVDRADIVGNPAQQHMARMRLAHVQQWRGDFAQSTMIFTELLAAAGQFGPVIEAFTHQHAGTNDYDQGHWADAQDHFAHALAIRDELELPDDSASSRGSRWPRPSVIWRRHDRERPGHGGGTRPRRRGRGGRRGGAVGVLLAGHPGPPARRGRSPAGHQPRRARGLPDAVRLRRRRRTGTFRAAADRQRRRARSSPRRCSPCTPLGSCAGRSPRPTSRR